MGGQDSVVGLHHSCGHLGSWVDGELQLGLLAVVNRQALHQQGRETSAGASSKAVENQEALKACALISLRIKKGHVQCLQKVFIPLDLFHILLCYSLNSKLIKYILFHPSTHKTP